VGIIIGIAVWFQWFYLVREHITYMLYDKIRDIVESTSLTFEHTLKSYGSFGFTQSVFGYTQIATEVLGFKTRYG